MKSVLDIKESKKIRFFSNDYFIDNSILLVSMGVIIEDIQKQINARHDILRIQFATETIIAKRKDIYQFYKHGGTVILVADELPYFHFGGNQEYLDLLWVFHEEGIGWKPINSDVYECDPVMKVFGDVGTFDCKLIFRDVETAYSKLLWTKKTQDPLAVSFKIDNGLLIILPKILFGSNHPFQKEKELLKSIKELIKSQRNNNADFLENAPEWINQISIEYGDVINSKIDQLNEKKRALEEELKVKEADLLYYSIIKSISYTKGPALEIGVKACLKHFNIDFIDPNGSETDLIILEDNQYYAVEIKGGNGSASKAHVRQLEDWVSKTERDYSLEEVAAKGILIINTYNETAINDRSKMDFPPNVLEYSNPRNHCLVTTLTLLTLVNDFDNKKINKQNIINLFKNTVGVLTYPGCPSLSEVS